MSYDFFISKSTGYFGILFYSQENIGVLFLGKLMLPLRSFPNLLSRSLNKVLNGSYLNAFVIEGGYGTIRKSDDKNECSYILTYQGSTFTFTHEELSDLVNFFDIIENDAKVPIQ